MAIIRKIPGSPLGELLSGVFHQDWDREFDDPWQGVNYFSSAYSVEAVEGALTELNLVLARGLDEQGLETVMDGYGTSLDPTQGGFTIHQWLTLLAERLQTAVEERTSRG